MQSLKKKAISGASWSLAGKILQNAGQFVIGIIMARLLTPAEYGLVAMATVFIAMSYTFVDSGFGIALIQRKEINNADLSTVFYTNLVISSLVFLAFFWGAPLIAMFYAEPKLVELVRVLSVLLLLYALSIVQNALLIRDLRFKFRTTIEFSSQIISGAVGIYLAYRGYGVWALVWKTLINQLLINLQLWLRNKWVPGFEFSIKALKEMFGFGSKFLLSSILEKIHKQITTLVIGKFYPAAELGLYNRADQFQKLPSQVISGSILSFVLPVFSKMQDNPLRLRSALKKVVQIIMFLNIPAMIWLAIAAHPLILVLLGEKWIASVDYLQLLVFAGILYPMHMINVQALTALGRSDLFLKIEILKKLLSVPVVLIAIFSGIKPMIIAMIVTSVIALFINTFYTGKLIGFGFFKQIAALKNTLLTTILLCMVILVISYFAVQFSLTPLIHLTLLALGGLVTFVGTGVLFNLYEFNELRSIVLNKSIK